MKLNTSSGNGLPEWAEFFRVFGLYLSTESQNNDSWHVFTMPNSRMASALLGIGYLSARFSEPEFQKRESLDTFSKGDQITWLTHDRKSIRHGYFESIKLSSTDPTKKFFKYVDSELGPVTRQEIAFDVYRFSKYSGAEFKRPRPLSSNMDFLDAFAPELLIDLATKSSSEICFIGDMETRLDLLSNELSCSGRIGSPDDILRVQELDDVGESPHFLSLYANPAARTLNDISTKLAIYDGSAAVRKQLNYVDSPISVVVLDRWDHNSREVFATLKNVQMRSRGSEKKLPTGLSLPAGMEYISWESSR